MGRLRRLDTKATCAYSTMDQCISISTHCSKILGLGESYQQLFKVIGDLKNAAQLWQRLFEELCETIAV